MASKEQVQFHYDVDNDFYGLFLDDAYRVYSCAVWQSAKTLESAQLQKLERMLRYANVQRGQRIMDVGCGWGGLMRYAVNNSAIALAHGLTLSKDQHRYVSSLAIPQITASLQSWSEYRLGVGEDRYDALVSIGAFEHFASLDDRGSGRHRDIYGAFFDWCADVTIPDAHIGLQSIVTAQRPRNRDEVRDARYLLDHVFPGSALPSVSDIQAAIVDRYEILALKRIGLDYVRTLQCWRERLLANQNVVEEKYGATLFAHYEKYFSCAIRNFSAGVVDLLQVSLRPTAEAQRRQRRACS